MNRYARAHAGQGNGADDRVTLVRYQRYVQERLMHGDSLEIEGYEEDAQLLSLALATLALSDSVALQLAAAKHPHTPAAALAHLANAADEELRIAVASNPSSPPHTLTDLAQHDNLVTALAGNPALPVFLLVRFACHWNQEVRRRAAFNPAAPEMVRRGVAEPVLPPDAYVG